MTREPLGTPEPPRDPGPPPSPRDPSGPEPGSGGRPPERADLPPRFLAAAHHPDCAAALAYDARTWAALGPLEAADEPGDAPAVLRVPGATDPAAGDLAWRRPGWAVWRRGDRVRTVGDPPEADPPEPLEAAGLGPWRPAQGDGYRGWRDRVGAVLRRLEEASPLEKVVLSRRLQAPLTGDPSPAALLARLAAVTPADAAVLLRAPDGAATVAATPEPLLVARGGRVRATALAATRWGSAPWREKERREHRIVADHVEDTLAAAGLDARRRGPREVEAGPVRHLRTDLVADTPSHVTPLDLASALHPTPAVVGHPVDAALESIQALETGPRNLYTGLAGLRFPDGSTRIHVLLRCLRLGAEAATLPLGAGLTSGSRPDEEWDETARKARAVTDALPGDSR